MRCAQRNPRSVTDSHIHPDAALWQLGRMYYLRFFRDCCFAKTDELKLGNPAATGVVIKASPRRVFLRLLAA